MSRNWPGEEGLKEYPGSGASVKSAVLHMRKLRAREAAQDHVGEVRV